MSLMAMILVKDPTMTLKRGPRTRGADELSEDHAYAARFQTAITYTMTQQFAGAFPVITVATLQAERTKLQKGSTNKNIVLAYKALPKIL